MDYSMPSVIISVCLAIYCVASNHYDRTTESSEGLKLSRNFADGFIVISTLVLASDLIHNPYAVLTIGFLVIAMRKIYNLILNLIQPIQPFMLRVYFTEAALCYFFVFNWIIVGK